MYGIESVIHKNGLSLLISNLQTSRSSEMRINNLVQGKHIQGIILSSFILNPSLLSMLKALSFPFVALGEPENSTLPFDWVDINNAQGGQQAVQHLIDADYHRIAFLSGDTNTVFNRNRLTGYRSMLRQYNLPEDDSLIANCDGSKDDAYISMSRLLSLTPPPDAVICSDNIISIGAMKAIKEKKIDVPNEIGIVSFDSFPIADLVEPTLTTVDIDVYEMGVEAAKLLLKLMENPSTRHQSSLISTSIQMRESTMK